MSIFSRSHDVLIYLPSITSVLMPEEGPPAGGAEVQMWFLARRLASMGAKVCIVAFDDSASLPDRIDGVNISRRVPNQSRRGVLGKLREMWAIFSSIAAADADVVITMTARPTTALIGLSTRLQCRRFVYASASDADFDMTRVERKRRRNITMFNFGVRLANRVVVQNDLQRDLCERRFRRTPAVIKSFAEPAERRDQEPEAFLWAGRIVWYKQPLAYVQLARAVPEARFWMVGVPEPDEDRQRLLEEVRQAAAAVPNLELLAPGPRAEILDLIDRAVAVVNTSEYEGLSNTFLEAWARGVPALSLCHDPDRLLERMRLGGFAGGSLPQLASMARGLWSSRHDQSSLGNRCRDYVLGAHAPEVVGAQWLEELGLAGAERTSQPMMVETA